MDLHGPRKTGPVVHLRRILVYSSANAAGQAKARAAKLAKAAAELDKLVRTAGTRFHPTDDAVAARVQAIAARRRAGKHLRTAITARPAGAPPTRGRSSRPTPSGASPPPRAAPPPPPPTPPASKPGYWTSSTSTSAGPAGSSSEIPCAKPGASCVTWPHRGSASSCAGGSFF